jgi:hypothetical protein
VETGPGYQKMISVQRLADMAIESTIVAVEPLATPPSAPATVTVSARNLGILVQWSKVPGADGYNLLISSDADMASPDIQVAVAGSNSVEYFYNTGHTAQTKYVAVQSYKGSRYSDYTAPQSVTTTEAQAASNFPVSATFTAETTIATVTITTTGGTLLAIGNAVLTQAAGDTAVVLRLKEDGATIRTVQTAARTDAALVNGWQSTTFNFSTPTAGAHTYILTAESLGLVCTASDIGLIVLEVPLVVMAAAAAPPSPPVTPQAPTDYPMGPEIARLMGF